MEEERYIEILTTYSPMVYRIALHDCRNHADAEDVMQDVFFRLYRFRPEFENEEHLKRWLIQVTVRESRRLFEKPFRKREELLEEIHPGIGTRERKTAGVQAFGNPADRVTEEDGVLADVLLLPRKYRVVIYLYYYEEYSIREIAKMLGKKESTIQTQLARARRKLKQKWEEEQPNETEGRVHGIEKL